MIRSVSVIAIGILSGCAVSPPKNTENACQLLAEKPGWYDAVNDASGSWNVSEGLILSFIRQESSFVSNAKPPRTKILGIIPGPRASSAYGYPQAKDGTWGDYRQATNSYLAVRDNFRDAADFVGWYVDQTYRKMKVSKTNYFKQYLYYYNGWTKQLRPESISYAKTVARTAKKYKKQIMRCQSKLNKKKYIVF